MGGGGDSPDSIVDEIALGGGRDDGISEDSLEEAKTGKIFPSWSVAAILVGDEAEQMQTSGPHTQIWGQAGGYLFPSWSVVAILFGSVQLTLFLEH